MVGSDLNFYKCAYLEVATPLHSYAKLPPYYTAVLRLYSTATLLHCTAALRTLLCLTQWECRRVASVRWKKLTSLAIDAAQRKDEKVTR